MHITLSSDNYDWLKQNVSNASAFIDQLVKSVKDQIQPAFVLVKALGVGFEPTRAKPNSLAGFQQSPSTKTELKTEIEEKRESEETKDTKTIVSKGKIREFEGVILIEGIDLRSLIIDDLDDNWQFIEEYIQKNIKKGKKKPLDLKVMDE
ncbi:MAG: hypothetical protein QXM61_06875, partial [Archaeoglobaceae archaeon]